METPLQDGIYLAPGTEQLIAIVPKVYNTTVEAIDKFDPKWRNCYTDPVSVKADLV